MGASAYEPPVVSSRGSGEGGWTCRGGIHAVIRRLSDAPDGKSKIAVSANGVSPQLRTSRNGLLHQISEASNGTMSRPIHASIFKPDTQSKSRPSAHAADWQYTDSHPDWSCSMTRVEHTPQPRSNIYDASSSQEAPAKIGLAVQTGLVTKGVRATLPPMLEIASAKAPAVSNGPVKSGPTGAAAQSAVSRNNATSAGRSLSAPMLPMTQPVRRRDTIFTAAIQTNRTSPRQRKQPVSDEHLQQLKSPPFFGWQHSDCHSTLPSSMKSSPGKDAATQAPHSQSAQHRHVRGQTAHSSSSVQLVRQSSSPWSTAVEGRCVKSASDTTWKGKRAMPPTISPTNQPDDLRTSAQERPELPSARAHFPVAPRSRSTIGTAATISADSAGHMDAAQAGKHATGSSVSQKGSSTSLHELSMDVRSGDLEATSALRHTTPMAAARGPLSPWSQGDKELPVSLREAGMPLHAALADGGMDRATLSPFPRSTDSRPPHSASTQCSATFPTSQDRKSVV